MVAQSAARAIDPQNTKNNDAIVSSRLVRFMFGASTARRLLTWISTWRSERTAGAWELPQPGNANGWVHNVRRSGHWPSPAHGI